MQEKLEERIYKFLDKYAVIRPDCNSETDPEDEKYTSPDASQMKYSADMISKGLKPTQCWSEWSSGGYFPYHSRDGVKEHNELVKEIYNIIKS